MSQFSSPESVSLERTPNLTEIPHNCPANEIPHYYEIDKLLKWISEGGYERVCLQFPDHLLGDSTQIAHILQEKLGRNVYILADTAYESCCIDYVAAEHVKADAIVHFGPVCWSQTSANVPHLNIYEKRHLDVEQFSNNFASFFGEDADKVLVVLDDCYVHLQRELQARLGAKIERFDELERAETGMVVFLSENARKVLNFDLIYKPQKLFRYTSNAFSNFHQDPNLLKRRYFLSETIKDSQTIGIVVGTLAVKNYLHQINRLKKLIQLNAKKYYLISVGKASAEKLANFPEIDAFVIVTCAQNAIFDKSRGEFYKPIVTPFDIELALNPSGAPGSFSFDFNELEANELNEAEIRAKCENDVSLISGKVRTAARNVENEGGMQVEVRNSANWAVQASSGGGFLNARTWKGLEQNLGGSDAERAAEGRSGIAQGYANEL